MNSETQAKKRQIVKQLKRQIDGSTCKRIDTGSQRGRQRDT